MRALALVMCLASCAISFDGERKVARRPAPGAATLRTDTVPGATVFGSDGTLKFQLDTAALCKRDKAVVEEIGVDERKRFSGLGLALTVISVAMIPISIYMFTQIESDSDGFLTDGSFGLLSGGIVVALTGAIGSGFLFGFRYGEPTGYPKTKGYRKTDERTITLGTERVACDGGAATLGDLLLATPWGATSQGRADGDGLVTFDVDWGDDRASAIPAAQLATGWRVSAPSTTAAVTWTPTAAETARFAQLIADAKNRVIVGTTPAKLVVEVSSKAIEIGGGGQLIVTVRNTGGSTASGVTAITRSSIAALHKLQLAFGTIQPNAVATRSIDVKVGVEVTEDAATVLVTASDNKGASVEQTTQLPLTRTLCPGGKLTRAQYDDKRAKLKKTLADKLITQEEFARLDADLLRCVE